MFDIMFIYVYTYQVKKVDIFPVGIGNGIKKSELKKLAGDEGHYFHIANFRELCSVLEELKDAACGTVFFLSFMPSPVISIA